MNLDRTDVLLYEALRRNGRASMEELAKVVGLSRVSVRERVTRLIEGGALRITGIVHPGTQGMNAVAHLSLHVDGSAKRAAASLADLDSVLLVSVVAGNCALVAEVTAPDLASLRDVIRSIGEIRDVVQIESAIYTAPIKDLYAPTGVPMNAKIDETDKRILDALEEDGRASYAKIARTMNTSPSTIRARVNRLIGQDVVRISAVISPSVFGLQFMCGFGVQLSPLQESATISAIEAMPAVSYFSLALSRWDAVGTLLAKSLTDVFAQLDFIRSLPGVGEMASWMHLEVIKENYQFKVFKSSSTS